MYRCICRYVGMYSTCTWSSLLIQISQTPLSTYSTPMATNTMLIIPLTNTLSESLAQSYTHTAPAPSNMPLTAALPYSEHSDKPFPKVG